MFIVHCSHGATLIFDDVFFIFSMSGKLDCWREGVYIVVKMVPFKLILSNCNLLNLETLLI